MEALTFADMFWTKIIFVIVVLLAVVVTALVKNNRIFCLLPNNHYAGVFLFGKFSHVIVHKDDYERVVKRIDDRIAGLPSGDSRITILNKTKGDFEDRVKPRSGVLIDLFNLCFISLNPFKTLKKINGSKKYLVEKAGEKVKDHYREDKLESHFLRVVFPRVELLEEVELANNTQIDFIAFCADMMIMDPKRVFVDYNGDVGVAVDSPLNAAFINYFASFKRPTSSTLTGPMTYDEFQEASFSADPKNPFNQSMLDGDSFYASGLIPNGPFSISYFELSGGMAAYAEAKQKIVVAEAEREAKLIDADADAKAKLQVGTAEADVIKLKEKAKVAGSEALADIAVSIPNEDQRDAYVKTAVAASIGSATAPLSIGGNGLGILVTEKEKPTIVTP